MAGDKVGKVVWNRDAILNIPLVDDRKPLKIFRLETNTDLCRHGSTPQCAMRSV